MICRSLNFGGSGVTVDEGIQKIREVGMVEWICHIKTTPQRDGLQNDPLTLRKNFWSWGTAQCHITSLASMRS